MESSATTSSGSLLLPELPDPDLDLVLSMDPPGPHAPPEPPPIFLFLTLKPLSLMDSENGDGGGAPGYGCPPSPPPHLRPPSQLYFPSLRLSPPSQLHPPPSPPATLAAPSPPEPPDETPFPVKPPEAPNPPDVRLFTLGLFVTYARSVPKATQALDVRFNPSWVSSKLCEGDSAHDVFGDAIPVFWRSFHVLYMLSPCQLSFPVVYRSGLCQRLNGLSNRSCSSFMFIHSLINVQVHLSSFLVGYPYSFEWDAMIDVWVIRALFDIVLMDFVSFSYIFMSPVCFYSAIECSLRIDSWFQNCLTSSRVEYSMLVCRFSDTWWVQRSIITTTLKPNSTLLSPLVLYCCYSCVALSTDDALFVMVKGSTSWYHIASAIPCAVGIRGHLCNEDAVWDAKSWHCDIGVIFSGENTIALPNLCESRNHVSSALMAEAFAVYRAVSCAVFSSVRSLAVPSELFGFTFVIYHFVPLFDVIFFSCISLARSVMNSIVGD